MDEHNDLVCGVAHFGAPSVFFEYNFTINELYGSFVSLNKMFNGKLNGIICFELGGCNGLSPLIVSMACGLPLFDINFMCRAFPEYKMTLPCINGNIGLPISFGDAKHNRFIIESLYSEENDRSS